MTIKERPILFSGPMVRAILEGRKSQTRRVVKPQPVSGKMFYEAEWPGGARFVSSPLDETRQTWTCPYGVPGDRLWAREMFSPFKRCSVACPIADAEYVVLVDGSHVHRDGTVTPGLTKYSKGAFDHIKWRPSIHMPRWASRLTLEVKGVRVERVQDISEADARAEGIIEWSARPGKKKHYGVTVADVWEGTATEAFARLWGSINGKTHPWASNPFVWVVEFERVNESRRDAGETER